MKIKVESIEVYAKLNYLRDKAFGLLDDDETWQKVKEEYMEEAKADKDIILTLEEVNAIMNKMK